MWMWRAVILAVILHCHSASKYTKEMNEHIGASKSDSPFRMKKINLIWQKAQKRLTSNQLADLYHDLTIQDKMELQVKKRVTEGLDEDGEFSAAARARLLDTLESYGMYDSVTRDNVIPESVLVDKDPTKPRFDPMKLDEKLFKLWNKAQLAGFTEEQLLDLRKELVHHQQKLDEFNQLKDQLNFAEGTYDNSVENFRSDDLGIKDQKQKNKDLKAKHREIKSQFEYLEGLTNTKPGESIDFTEPKVIELWLLARKTNMSDLELTSLKEELHHFEHKLKKHGYYKSEAELSEKILMESAHKNNFHPGDKKEKLDSKVNDYARKIKKIHTELKTRISKALGRHTEL